MFFRLKPAGKYQYLQIVENHREGKKVKQTVIATIGRLDRLADSGAIDKLVASAARFAEKLIVLCEHDTKDEPHAKVVAIGPALIFERLWRDTRCAEVIRALLAGRHFGFDVERAVFFTVVHRLLAQGSDRSAVQWRAGQQLQGTEQLKLHQLYRAMGWLGEILDDEEPGTRFARRIKDRIEEELFDRRRDLFTALDLVFFDTTSLYFTGEGGESLGRYDKSKDHRNDCKQMAGIPANRCEWAAGGWEGASCGPSGRGTGRLCREKGLRRRSASARTAAHTTDGRAPPLRLHVRSPADDLSR